MKESAKKYLPPTVTPPVFPFKKLRDQAQAPKTAMSTSLKAKAFADDLTIISRSLPRHQQVRETTVTKCVDLDLQVRPDKCVSILFDGKKILSDSSIDLPSGRTNSIRTAPTKFLGGYIGQTQLATRQAASTRLLTTATKGLSAIDSQPIRGEFKCWILKHYLAPSLHFYLAIDDISEEPLKKLQAKVSKLVKKWLNLPRSATLAALYHPTVLALPFFSHSRLKAKVDYLSAISTSTDPVLGELSANLLAQNLPPSIPGSFLSLLKTARDAIAALSPANTTKLKQATRSLIQSHQTDHWDSHLDTLQVQSKFKDIVALESNCKVWSKIQSGLPAGQLSFILRARMDCLPTPLNLCRWKIQTDPKCPLCSWPKPTSMHILNGCATALNQGRYTWRHDSILQEIVKHLKPLLSASDTQCTLYADLPGYRASNNPPATVPLDLSVSPDRPDLVLVSIARNSSLQDITILELTVPSNTKVNLDGARKRKLAKYQPLITDLQSHPRTRKVQYSTIEVGSLGHSQSASIKALSTICLAPWKEAGDILCAAGKVAVGCSHFIFRARKSSDWDSNKPLYSLS